MKLSTFVKLVKKQYIAKTADYEQRKVMDTLYEMQQAFICNSALDIYYSCKNKTTSTRMHKVYNELLILTKKEILSRIYPKLTVGNYMRWKDMPTTYDTIKEFRLALLEDLIDWAKTVESQS